MRVTYYNFNEQALGLGSIGLANPPLVIGIPLLLFVALTVHMYYIMAYVPGGKPVDGLERWSGKAAKAVRNLFARRR